MAPPQRSRVTTSGPPPNAATKTLGIPENSTQATGEGLSEPIATVVDSSRGTASMNGKAQSVIQGIEKLALADAQSSEGRALTLQGRDGGHGGTDSAGDDQSHWSSSS